MRAFRLVLPLVLGVGLAVVPGEAAAKPRPTRAAHPASQRTKAATGAQRRQNWRNTRSDVKSRFRALGRSFKGKK